MSTQNEERLLFEDSSSEGEDIPISFKKRERDIANMTITKANNSNLKTLKEFLMNPGIITVAGNPDSNIIDRCSDENNERSGRCYKIIDQKKISKLMAHLEIARRDNLNLMFYEKQLEFSGIMDDFDIPQKEKVSQINSQVYHRYCREKVKILSKCIDFKGKENISITIAFTKKPCPVFKKEKGAYYDGFHALIPGIQITRACKRFINNLFIEESINTIFQDFKIPENKDLSEIFDTNSAHVGVHFLGCKTQVSKKAYILDAVYEVSVDLKSNSTLIVDCTSKFNDKRVNQVYELSLNWMRGKKHRMIEKSKYNIKDEYSKYLSESKSNTDFEEPINSHGKLSTLAITDSESISIKEYLDILNVKRSESYVEWWEIMVILANTSPSYKSLAYYFSSKSKIHASSPRFEEMFEQKWTEALKTKSTASVGSLCFLAKMDNPEAYKLVNSKSLFTIVNRMIYSPSSSGYLGHFDLAIILEHMLRYKYTNSVKKGHSRNIWFEFITPEDPMVKGEVYKWRSYEGRKPPSMIRFVSEKMTVLLESIITNISESIDTAEDENLKNAHISIKKNLIKTIQSLKNVPTVKYILEAAENIFEKNNVGFCSELDSNPYVLGVGNGLLDLSSKIPKHVTGYSGYNISKYTSVDYIPFNPYAPKTKGMLEALHNLFPDDEGDTFDWVMSYYASTLDNTQKESIFLAIVGGGSNGKSFINELHRAVLGNMYSSSMNPSFLLSSKFSKSSNAPSPDLLSLEGVNWVHFSETNMIAVLDSAKLKRITGGDSISGRLLYQNLITHFKARCHMTMTSNYDFDIEGNDHGTWRRIVYLIFKMRMVEVWKGESYDPNDKYTRIANHKVGKEWVNDPEYLSAYLSILTYYYYRLHTIYGGKTMSVPHPNIERDTEDFRNRQDKINEFICTYLVKVNDELSEMKDYEDTESQSLIDIMGLYKIWYTATYPGKENKFTHLMSEFKNSKLSDILTRTRKGEYITGYRILRMSEEPELHEKYVYEIESKSRKKPTKNETFEEYYIKLCKEYDNLQKEGIVFSNSVEKKFIYEEKKLNNNNDTIADLREKRRKKNKNNEISTETDLSNYNKETGLYQSNKTDDYDNLFN